ncbi:protogenin A-like [Tribolium madens]|uniref:protogenin A-like n=1 Tax=Tribolium madens TaxID=41895 RepID=UPI001CF746BE|nr:protogenin A-like [Tribolium madens]
MALRILQFGIVFAIGYYLGPASPFAGAVGHPEEVPLSIELKDPQDVTVSRGQSAILQCDTKSLTPGLQISWLYNDNPVDSNDTRRVIQEDGSLYFPKVGGSKKTKGLVGEYRCRAMVQNVSLLSNPAKLKIASFGDFDKPPSNLSVPESQPAVLFCNINSFPAAQIKWEQDFKPLPHNTRYVPLPTGALLITKTHSSDAGSYRCIATNNLLKKTKYSKIVELTVSSTPMKTVEPTFLPLNILPNTTVLIGENINLYCAVTGWPIPTVQWLNYNSIVISNSSVLQIRNASFEDAGDYTCLAYNSGGRVSQKYTLDVYQKPYFNVTPISKIYPPARTVRLDCQAKGVPKPKIYWLKNSEPLPNAARIKKHPTGLVISHTFTSDSGIYQCIAVNAAGRVWAAAQLIPTFVHTPSPPENVQCRPFDDTSICLSWETPHNVSVKAYSIYCYYTAMGREIPGPDFVTNKTQHLASGLNTNTNYTCYIRLYSKIASDRSQQVTCKTGVKGWRNLQVIPVNDTSVELSWTKISTDVPCDGTKEFYKVQWKKKGRSLINSKQTDEFLLVISGLSKSMEYEFRVIPGWQKNDDSPWVSFTPKGDTSRKISANTTDLIPLAPERLEADKISATSVNLTWIDNNENTRFYSVCATETDKQIDCDEHDLMKSASNHLLITDLLANFSYDFKVRAHNYRGYYSPFSQSATIRTRADVPSKVLHLNYEIVNETAVCLHWQAPLHTNGKLTSYLILYTPNSNWPLDEWFNKSVPTTLENSKGCWFVPNNDQLFSTLLVGLDSSKQYTVYVRAASEVGLGNPIYPIKITTRNTNAVAPETQDDVQYNQILGIIMGVTISLLFIVVCVSFTILVRKRCLKTRAFSRARMAASNNYYPAVAQYASEGSSVQVRLENPCSTIHEIEHLVSDDASNHIPPDTPTHLDTKGTDGFPNGHLNGSAKPYTNGHVPNGIVHITENPRYYMLKCNGLSENKSKAQEMCCTPYEEDSNSNLKTSKFQDLHRIFENSKDPEIKSNRQCNLHLKRSKLSDSKNNSSFKDVRPNG